MRRSSGGKATPLASAGRSLSAASARARLLHQLGKARRWRHLVDDLPLLGALGAHAFRGGAEDIGEVTPHLALVDETRQAAGAGEHAQKRHFRQADRRRAVIDHEDLVAGKRDLVAAAGAGCHSARR